MRDLRRNPDVDVDGLVALAKGEGMAVEPAYATEADGLGDAGLRAAQDRADPGVVAKGLAGKFLVVRIPRENPTITIEHHRGGAVRIRELRNVLPDTIEVDGGHDDAADLAVIRHKPAREVDRR